MFLLILTSFVVTILLNNLKQTEKDSEAALIQEAILHYDDIINTRKWNAHFGGVYVKPADGITPNPYLPNNTLKVDENLTLIKINPAWMTRQLSEISSIEGYSFRLTSLDPTNPINVPDAFETEALTLFEKDRDSKHHYKRFPDKQQLRFAGAMVTAQSCLACHKQQGYTLGDIRGAISITLSTETIDAAYIDARQRTIYIMLLFAAIILILIVIFQKQLIQKLSITLLNKDLEAKQAKIETFNQQLEEEVKLKTDELRAVLNSQSSIIMVTDGHHLLSFNSAFERFFSKETVNAVLERKACICDSFIDRCGSFTPTVNNQKVFWAFQIMELDEIDRIVTLADQEGLEHTFNVTINTYDLNEDYFVISMSDITLLAEESKAFEDQAAYDPLTHLYNRRKFTQLLQQEIDRANRYSHPLSTIMFDIDHFKEINDTHGHAVGDAVLTTLADYIKEHVRDQDIVVRWGGEEFIILLPHSDIEQAEVKAEMLRSSIEAYTQEDIPHFTISLGVTKFHTNESAEDLLNRVDRAMYEAKEGGRNKVVSKI
ncbi:MAG: diguanylate cyclase [Campylobacterota bacterium]|nr:diguanylate cyclase [Campylobacterota bacterium]